MSKRQNYKESKRIYEKCMKNVICGLSFKEFSIANFKYIEARNKKQNKPVRQITEMAMQVRNLLKI